MAGSNLLIIANLIADRMAEWPDRDVLTFEFQGQFESRTYRQLWENSQKIAAGLQAAGMKQGDRFAILLENHPEFVEMMIASAILGTVFVPIDPRTRGAKLAYMLRDSGSKGVVCAPYSRAGVLEALVDSPGIAWIASLGAAAQGLPAAIASFGLNNWLAAACPQPEFEVAVTDETMPMQLMYTSGTTGDPKGIVIPHGRFGMVSGHGEAVFGYRAGDRPYTGLSLTHGNGQFVTLAPSLKMGLRAVISRKFTKSRLWDIIRQQGCTTFSLLGGMVTAIFAEPVRDDDADNPVRLVVSAGMPANLWTEFERRYGLEVFEFYGAMEGGMSFKRPGEGPIGSCGRAAPGLVAVVTDEDGNEVPRGTSGELRFRLESGDFPPVTYVNNPEASTKKVQNGWLLSGDIVHMDEEGWIFYEYRKGGGLRRNGDFVSRAFVERALAEHPGVDDIFVYGVPASNGAPGEKDVVAAIVPLDEDCAPDLFAWAKDRLEANMVPTYIQFVDQIPKTASEKPQERFLLDQFKARNSRIYTIEGEFA
ncbi:AMP-binding protein [Novosphingobium album (ex Hu et al. 2023)]|uniref:AMP-binding protein n=1 Tax=Novosphingobium album (ex Hu et al. 2023) TaxID=2930093 RepID=A0ABT0AZM1_9SPHN|nr:AMP-binding protein [Novosphingobium album (ex Hu et al. 2023)]MCJ2178080.1 AMP-binding protein [Novosphingobium album (ex Hu et al. 2023)]